MYGAPVDLSFKCISTVADALTEEPNEGIRRVKRDAEKKYCSRSLRLNNNIISNLKNLSKTISHFMSEPSHLAWLDLSFNDLTDIDPVLCELLDLRVLYLHGNSITKLSDVDKLGALPYLHTFTLHGNPLENESVYRRYIIGVLPQLKTMDFSAITHQERIMARIWYRPCTRSKPTKKDLST